MTQKAPSAARAAWKRRYRAQRVLNREANKAWRDAIVFGSGFVEFNHGMDPRRIDPLSIFEPPSLSGRFLSLVVMFCRRFLRWIRKRFGAKRTA